MGQYWIPVNLDKKEYIDPHKLGTGLKLWEHLANHPGTGAALIVLMAAMPEPRGGGDFDMDENWHGPERTIPPHNISPGPMPENYSSIAKRTIGRWAGDRIALIGDYADSTDLTGFDAKKVSEGCFNEEEGYLDITENVCKVIEHELCGKYIGDGWREFKYDKEK